MVVGRDKLNGLSPYFRPWVEWLVDFASAQGVTVTVISGYRTLEDQRRAASQAKAAGRPAAKPGRSAHNFGMAVDLMAGANSSSADHEWLMSVWRAVGGQFYAGDRPHFEHPDWPAVREFIR